MIPDLLGVKVKATRTPKPPQDQLKLGLSCSRGKSPRLGVGMSESDSNLTVTLAKFIPPHRLHFFCLLQVLSLQRTSFVKTEKESGGTEKYQMDTKVLQGLEIMDSGSCPLLPSLSLLICPLLLSSLIGLPCLIFSHPCSPAPDGAPTGLLYSNTAS